MSELFSFLGMLVNTPEYCSYFYNDSSKMTPTGKWALWYLLTLFAFISSLGRMIL